MYLSGCLIFTSNNFTVIRKANAVCGGGVSLYNITYPMDVVLQCNTIETLGYNL